MSRNVRHGCGKNYGSLKRPDLTVRQSPPLNTLRCLLRAGYRPRLSWRDELMAYSRCWTEIIGTAQLKNWGAARLP